MEDIEALSLDLGFWVLEVKDCLLLFLYYPPTVPGRVLFLMQ